MDPSSVAPGGSTTALLFAIAALAISAVVPLLVAMISRGSKSKNVALDPAVVVPRSEFDRLVDTLAKQDDELHHAQRALRERDTELQRERQIVDDWQRRAYRAGWKEES